MRLFLLMLLLPLLSFGMKGGRRGHGGRNLERNNQGYGSINQKVIAGLRDGSVSTSLAQEILNLDTSATLNLIDKVLERAETIEDLVHETNFLKGDECMFRPIEKKKQRCCLWRYFCCCLSCCCE